MTRRTQRLTALLLAAVMVSACSGRDAGSSGASTAPKTTESGTTGGAQSPATTAPEATTTSGAPSATTPAATAEVDSVTWATYREVNTLDPIYAFDYPENTVITSMCES